MMKSHSNCCQLVWMFCSRQSNNLIDKVHARGPKLTYRAETKDFQQMKLRLPTDTKRAKWDYNSSKEFASLNDRIVENCKRYGTVNNEFSFSISLQHKFTENRKTVKYGTETATALTYRALFSWANIHTKFKNAKSLD